MQDLKGKSIIVTGSAMGMGEHTAKLLANKYGAYVVVADFNEEKGKKVTQEILDAGGKAAFFKVDVSDAEQVKAMVQFTVDTYGKLDAAVNNAARTPDNKPLAEMDPEVWNAVLNVDLTGVAICLKYEIAQMMKQGHGGAIVNTSSVSGVRPQPGTPAYIAAKHAVIGLTKSAAFDYSRHNIRVNTISPGAINTPMLQNALIEFNIDPIEYPKQLSLLGHFADPDEVAEANAWLVSDCSSYVTGANIMVDGGYTAM